MVTFLVVVVLLALLGVLGIIVEGLLWLTAFAVVLVLLAIGFVWWRFRNTGPAA